MHGVCRASPGIARAIQDAVVFYVQAFTGLQVAHPFELQRIERDALRGDHVVLPAVSFTLAQHERPNAVRVAKGDDAEADDHRDDRVTAAAALVHGFDGIENIVRRGLAVHASLQLVREHIEQHFGIRVGRQMPAIFANQQLSQLVVVRQVAVVREANTVR